MNIPSTGSVTVEDTSITPSSKVLLTDGIASVQSMKRTAQIATFMKFKEAFLLCVMANSRGYAKIRLIMDNYWENSMIEATRTKRAKERITYLSLFYIYLISLKH